MPVYKPLPAVSAAALPETGPARLQRLVHEARDLARDRPRICDGCRRRMRYAPTEGVPVQRAGSRGDTTRCQTCQIAPELIDALIHKRSPDLQWILDVRGQQLGALGRQLAELEALPPTPALQERELERARDRLCALIQLAVEELERIERYRSDTALVEELLRTGRAAHPGVPLRGIDWHAVQA